MGSMEHPAAAEALQPSPPAAPEGLFSGCLELQWEVAIDAALKLTDRARPIGRLACVSRGFRVCLSGRGSQCNKLKVPSIETSCIESLIEGLRRVSLPDLEVLRVDFSAERPKRLHRAHVERAMRTLSDCLSSAASLRVLSVRMACFDASMDRIRLSSTCWEAFLRGLSALARHGRLQSLELTSFTIKEHREQGGRQLRRAHSAPESEDAGAGSAAVAAMSASAKLLLSDVLAQMSSLQELACTSDEIFPSTAQLLVQAVHRHKQLKKIDLSRNHISKQVMDAARAALPSEVQLHGKQQTVCC